MKKVVLLASIFLVSSCWSGGKLNLFESRNIFIEDLQSYSISYFDQGPKLLKTEYLTEVNYPVNKVLTAHKGYTIADSKTYRKEYFGLSVARVNKNGGMGGASAPVFLKRNETKDVIGESRIDGTDYYLIPSNLETFVFLVKDDGEIYTKMGQIRNKKLVLLDTIYVPYPEDIRFEPVTNTSSKQSKPTKGFELKYEGLQNGKIAMTYFDYSSLNSDSGVFENLTIPNQEGEVNIRGTRLNILQATDQKLDYMIVEEE